MHGNDAELFAFFADQADLRRVDLPVYALLFFLSDGSTLHENQKSDRAGFRF